MQEHSFSLLSTDHSTELHASSSAEQHHDHDSTDRGAADATAADETSEGEEDGSRSDWRGSSSGKQYLGSDSLPASLAG